MCVQELNWAIDAGKIIVPVVVATDKPKVGEYIAEGKKKGVDLSGCDFKQVVTTSKEDCEAACCAEAGCVTWNWDSNLTRAQVRAHPPPPHPHPTTVR